MQNWTVFIDSNENGQRDGGERSTTTSEAGQYYFFGGVPTGRYLLGARPTEKWSETTDLSKWAGTVTWKAEVSAGKLTTHDLGYVYDRTGDRDYDEDGLNDEHEVFGYWGGKDTPPVDGERPIVDLPTMGANPLRKDIFVEIDYMSSPVRPAPVRPDAFKPAQESIDLVVDAFEAAPVENAVATYWNGDADTKTNRTAEADEAARPIVPPPAASPTRARPAARQFENAVECETMKIVAKSGDFPAAPQPLHRFGGHRWSAANHLFVRAGKIGDFVELRFPVEEEGPCKLIPNATRSHDYGVLRLTVNGQPTGENVDTYAEKPGPLGPRELGVFMPVDGAFTLRAEVVGKNAKSEKTGTYFGLDCAVICSDIGNSAPHSGK